MPNNPFDQFDTGASSGNAFDQFDASAKQNNQQASAAPQEKGNAFLDAIAVMNRNFATVANGQLQAAAQGLGYLGFDTSEFQNRVANFQRQNDDAYKAAMQNSPIAGTISDIGSSIGAAVATPGAQPFLAQSLGAAAGERIIGAGLASGVAGGSQYVPEGSENNRLDNAIQSGILGAGFQGAGEAIGKGIQAGANKLFSNGVDEAADIATGAVDPTVGMVTGNKGIQAVESGLSAVPVVGTKGALTARGNQLEGVTKNVLDDLGVGKQTKVELGQALQENITQAYNTARSNTDKAYNKALNIANNSGLSVPLSETRNIASKAIEETNALSTAGISSSTLNSKAGTLLQDISALPNGEVPAKMFDTLRKKVNSTIDTLAKGGDDEALLPAFKQIRGAMDTDLNALGEVNSKFGDALKAARETYKTEKLPFQENSILSKAVGGDLDVDKLLDDVVKNDRPILTSKIMNQLSPEGKKAFSTAIIQKAYKGAVSTEGDNAILNLNKFSGSLTKLGETLDALPKTEQLKIKGLNKLLTRSDYILKAGNRPTSSFSSGLLGTVGGVAYATSQLPQFLATAVGTKVISKLLTSPSLSRGLVRLAGGKLGTKATDGVVMSLLKKVIGNPATEGLKMGVKAGAVPTAATAIIGE